MAWVGSRVIRRDSCSKRRAPRGAARAVPACALLGLLLAACGRFGFETIPEFDLPSVLPADGGNDGQELCSLGTLSDCSACGDDCSARNLASVSGYDCVSAACAIASC